MAKLPLYAACITATFAILLIAAAAEDAALLKQAQGIFQPLPKDMATAEFPITRERVELGRSLFFDPRLTIDANMSCSSCHQPAFYGTDALPKPMGVKQPSAPRPDQPQCRDEFCHSLARRPDEPRGSGIPGAHLADHIRSARRESCNRSIGTHRGLCPAVQGGVS
jgi:cytochrome c peroxidase